MTRFRIILAISVLTTGASAAPVTTGSLVPSAPQDAVEAAIRATHRQMREAATRLDAAALYAHVLDTSTPPIIEDGAVLGSRATALASTRSGLDALSRLSYTYAHESITVLSGDAALWVADGTVNATLRDGREVTAHFAETILFVRTDGQWKVLHAHRSAPNAR